MKEIRARPHKWTEAEIEFLRSAPKEQSRKELFEQFIEKFGKISFPQLANRLSKFDGRKRLRASKHKWTEAEIEFLRSAPKEQSQKELLKHFIEKFGNISFHQLTNGLRKSYIRKRPCASKHKWTEAEIEFLRSAHKEQSQKELLRRFIEKFGKISFRQLVYGLRKFNVRKRAWSRPHKWTEVEIEFLRSAPEEQSREALFEEFIEKFGNISFRQLDNGLNKFDVRKKSWASKHKWTEAEIEFLRSAPKEQSQKELLKRFIEKFGDLTLRQLKSELNRLNIKGFYYQGKQRKQKGNRSFLSITQLPIGTERIRNKYSRFYIVVKIAEPNVWKAKDVITWEEKYGPVPKGYCVYNPTGALDCLPDDLFLISHNDRFVLSVRYGMKTGVDGETYSTALNILKLKKRISDLQKGKEL
jgi:hypothetical protein